MRDTIIDALTRHLSASLGHPIDLSTMSDTTELSSLGLDSILSITMLIGLAEEFDTDLEQYVDSLATPTTLGDLIAVVSMFAEKTHAA